MVGHPPPELLAIEFVCALMGVRTLFHDMVRRVAEFSNGHPRRRVRRLFHKGKIASEKLPARFSSRFDSDQVRRPSIPPSSMSIPAARADRISSDRLLARNFFITRVR